jgi:O-antigen ligase
LSFIFVEDSPVFQTNALQNRIARIDRRVYAALVGMMIGLVGGLVGLMIAVFGPPLAFGAVFGLMAGLYILTDVSAALYGVIAVLALLPFGTVPFKIGFVPTLLDVALAVFLVVYLGQWMTGRRHSFRVTPVHLLITLYVMWLLVSFALGLRYAMPTPAKLRQFAETLLAISLTFILVDLIRDPKMLRRLLVVVMLFSAAEAVTALVLYFMPDATAERTLIRLARIGYPNGGVIRYIEDNPANAERAIGTWVDPNAFGGMLAVCAALMSTQLFAKKPVLGNRWLAWPIFGIVAVALVLSYSRASMLALGGAMVFAGLFKGYRKFIPMVVGGLIVILILPQTQGYILRFVQAFTASDLATQMRLGEYGDSLQLIRQYPVTGVGFTGTPGINIYTDVASMYLIMANQIGLVGVAIFITTIGGVFVYGYVARKRLMPDDNLSAIHIGCHAALLAAMINGTADLYFFRLDFQASITLFWTIVSLALATSAMQTFAPESNSTLTSTPLPGAIRD